MFCSCIIKGSQNYKKFLLVDMFEIKLGFRNKVTHICFQMKMEAIFTDALESCASILGSTQYGFTTNTNIRV